MLKLEKAKAIPVILAAIAAKQLQAQQEGFEPRRGCRYSGPCAIGVLLDKKTREKADEYGAFYWLLDSKIVEADDETFFAEAQALHDNGDIEGLKLHCEGLPYEKVCSRND